MTKDFIKYFFVFRACQTIANEAFEHIKHDMIETSYKNVIERMKLAGAHPGQIKSKSAILKKQMERDYNQYLKTTRKMVSIFDDDQDIQEIVDYLYEAIDVVEFEEK